MIAKAKIHPASKAISNPKQEMFCQLFSGNVSGEFTGSGLHSYREAFSFDITTKKGNACARASASTLLKNPKIYKRINHLIQIELSEMTSDSQLSLCIMQCDDMKVKIAAIKHYDDIQGRITKKIEHSGKVALLPPVVE
jgi:hypothetical protein